MDSTPQLLIPDPVYPNFGDRHGRIDHLDGRRGRTLIGATACHYPQEAYEYGAVLPV